METTQTTPILARPQEIEQLEGKIQVANAISQSLLFSLGRQYLEVPFEEATHIQAVPPSRLLLEKPYFLRLEQVGSVASSLQQPFIALQTALSACHNPGRYTLNFIVSSDGHQNRVYLGARSHDSMAYSEEDFVNNLGHFVQGNWPGTRLRLRDAEDQAFKEHLLDPLKQLRYAMALTGIPSLKPGDQKGYPQSLDRLLWGMRGQPFMYMVVAEPMAEGEVNQIIYNLRELLGRIHTLNKITVNESLSTGLSQTRGRTESSSQSIATGTSQSHGKSSQVGADLSVGLVLGALALGSLFPPAALMSALAAGGAIILTPNMSRSWQQTEGSTSTHTTTTGVSHSETTGLTLNAAQTFGQEYINVHVQAAESLLKQYLERFEQARALGCWNVGVYLLAQKPEIAQRGGTQLRALLSGEKSAFEPIRLHDLKRVWMRGARTALQDFEQPSLALVDPTKPHKRLDHPLGAAFNGLTTPLNTEELTLLVNLPRHEVPGVQVMPSADFSLNPPQVIGKSITLGHLFERGEISEPTPLTYNLSLPTLAKHTLLTGISGSGKSTTCRRILREIYQRHHVPFLVIEPTKDEYVSWAMQFNKELKAKGEPPIAIYMPGASANSWRGQPLADKLHLNPFDIVHLSGATPQVLAHIDRLKSILNATFPMQEVLPYLLEELLFFLYKPSGDINWLEWSGDPKSKPRSKPSLRKLTSADIRALIASRGYDKRVEANLSAALITRLESLKRGWKGELFGHSNSTPWQELFDRPVVINLQHLGDNADRALAMSLLMLFLYEYRQAQFEIMSDAQREQADLRHLTVVEEAHRILRQARNERIEVADSQAKTSEMFADILSEMRAYGEGMMIVDQVPTKLIPDAIKNTNLKIVHRLVAKDDQEAMAHAMTLTLQQAAMINRLHPGQALVYGASDDAASWIKVPL